MDLKAWVKGQARAPRRAERRAAERRVAAGGRGRGRKRARATREPATDDDAPPAEPGPESPQYRALKLEYERLKRASERVAGHRAIIREAVEEAWERPVSLLMPPAPKQTGKGDEEVAILHISDIQYGKTTEDYDSTVAAERLRYLMEKTVRITEMRRSAARIDRLHVYLGGDLVEGELIFPHQAHLIDQSVFDQAVRGCPEVLCSILLYALKHFKRVHVVNVVGNHGRPAQRGAASHPRTNWDRVVGDVLRVMLLGTADHPHEDVAARLTFDNSETWYAVDEVLGWGNLVVHGDQVRGGFAGYPFYGVGKKAYGWIDTIPVSWDYLYLGHYHTLGKMVLNRRIWLANGTVESKNEYAAEQLGACGDPCQRLAFYSRKYGLIADHQVFLTKRTPNR